MQEHAKSSDLLPKVCNLTLIASKIFETSQLIGRVTDLEEMTLDMRNTRLKLKNQKGFNLIELMIVIAIIALLVAVGIPAWGAMVRAGNEASATQTMQTIRSCQTAYAGKNKGKFGNIADLVRSGCLEGDQWVGETPTVAGYIFNVKSEEPSGSRPAFYSVNADPQVTEGIQRTGDRHFYFDSSLGSVKVTDENRPAKADDPSM